MNEKEQKEEMRKKRKKSIDPKALASREWKRQLAEEVPFLCTLSK